MLHQFLIAAFCGFGFVVGAFLTFVLCMLLPRRFSKERNEIQDSYNERSLDALKERNAQWRPSQLDYFAAEALPILTEMWRDSGASDDAQKVATQTFKIARAMVDESIKHRNYLPDVPSDL